MAQPPSLPPFPPSPKQNNNCPVSKRIPFSITAFGDSVYCYFCIFYSTMALCNVLQFFVNTGDKRLSSIIVKGERIFQQDEGKKLFSMLGMLASIIFRETKQPLTKTLIYLEGRGVI